MTPTIGESGGLKTETLRKESLRISDEPLIRFIHRRLPETLAAFYLLFLVYISFVPFDFTWTPAQTGARRVWGLPGFGSPNLADILANIGAYAPLGLAWYAVLRRLGRARLASAAVVAIGSAALSFGIECGQTFLASRVASWVDVASDAIGAILGMSLAWAWEHRTRRLMDAARESARQNWWMAVSKVAVVVVLVVQLRPYDVVPDAMRTIKQTIRQTDARSVLGWNNLVRQWHEGVIAGRRSAEDLSRMRWEYGLDRVTDTLLYSGVATTIVLGFRAAGTSGWTSCGAAGFVAVMLSAMVMIVRMFLISHGLDAAQLLCGVAAWPVGCLIGGMAHRAAPRDGVRRTAPAGLAIVGIALLVAAYEAAPFRLRSQLALPRSEQLRSFVTPFLRHFESRPNDALYDISGDLLRYLALGCALALGLRIGSHRGWRTQAVLVVLGSVAASMLAQISHLFLVSRSFDITSVLLGACGAFAGAVGVRWYFDYQLAARTRVVEDLLTTQLIEGPGYDKEAAIIQPDSPRSDTFPTIPAESHRRG